MNSCPNPQNTVLSTIVVITLIISFSVLPFSVQAVNFTETTIWYSLSQGYSNAVFNDIAFLNATHGWVVGQWTEGMSGNGVVLHTVDGGETWTTQIQSGREQVYRQIDILHSESVWITSWGGLLHTSDDGQTWDEYSVVTGNTLMSTVEFLNDTHGWTATMNTLYNTSDGGETWSTVSGWTFDDSLRDMQFVTETEVWGIGFFGIYHSEDSAETWTQVHNSGGWSLSIQDDGEGWAVADSNLMHSSDGIMWDDLTVPGPAPLFRSRAPYLGDILFIDDEGWIVGEETPVMHTVDNGLKWYEQSVPESINRRLLAVDFLNQTHGWAAGGGGAIIKTTNGNNLGSPFDNVFLPILSISAGFILLVCSILFVVYRMRKKKTAPLGNGDQIVHIYQFVSSQ